MKYTTKQVGGAVAATVGVLASLVGVLSYVDDKRAAPPPTARTTPPEIQKITLHDSAETLADFLRKVPDAKGRRYTGVDLRRRGYSFLLQDRKSVV